MNILLLARILGAGIIHIHLHSFSTWRVWQLHEDLQKLLEETIKFEEGDDVQHILLCNWATIPPSRTSLSQSYVRWCLSSLFSFKCDI